MRCGPCDHISGFRGARRGTRAATGCVSPHGNLCYITTQQKGPRQVQSLDFLASRATSETNLCILYQLNKQAVVFCYSGEEWTKTLI